MGVLPQIQHEIAWNSGPLQAYPPALYSNFNPRVLRPWQLDRGQNYELQRQETGVWRPVLDNRDGAWDPTNTLSPYAPNVVPYKPVRIRCQTGVNMLTPDQATAGEASQITGLATAWSKLGVVNDFGYQLKAIASGSAWQGTQVYQAVLPSGATQYSTILMIQALHVQPNAWYSFTAQAQVVSGNSPQCNIGILFYDNNGTELAADGGASQTLTAGAGTWTALTESAQAPSGAYSAWVKVELSGAAALTAATTFLIDGLQWEQSMTPTPWQMPLTVSQNLLPQQIATGTQSINPVSDSPAKWFYPVTGSVSQANWLPAPASGQTTALAWTTPIGTTSASPLYVGVANPNANNPAGPVQDITQVTPLLAYTGSVYLSRTSSADATVQVTVSFRWHDQYGNLLSTSAGTPVTVPTGGAWVRGTVTANAPSGAAWCRMRIAITSPASTTASNTVFSAGWQLEQASAATAWADPGPFPSFFAGFLEQYPQDWELSGTWGRLDAVAVDALGGLGTDQFFAPFIEEVLALSPTFLYQLADPASATMLVDTTGNCPNAAIGASVGGTGSLTLGAGISGTNTFTGTQGPVAALANTPSTNTQSPMSFVALPAQATTPNYGIENYSLLQYMTPFTRMIAFCVSALPAHPMYLWSATMSANSSPQPTEVSFWIDASGHLNITAIGSQSYTQTYSSQSYADGNWHLASFGVDTSGNARFSIDGVATSVTSEYVNPVNLSRDTIGGRVQDPAPSFTGGANAQIALAIQWPQVLTAAQITNLYNSWRSASAGESSGARVARVLNWAGWPGAVALDTGSTSAMGGATDLAGTTAVNAVQQVATTENGQVFASAAGAITFKGRSARYNQNTPQLIFGENWAWGEWPYEQGKLPVDPLHTYNDVQVSQYSAYSQYSFFTQSQQTAYAASAASQNANFDRVLARTVNVQSFSEAISAAQFLLGQYQNPTMRSTQLKFNCTAIPGLLAALLTLELGSRVRQMKRPPYRSSSNPIAYDAFVERISFSFDPRGPFLYCTLELSPAIRSQYWTMSALRTTLHLQATSGTNTATINALPDSAVNNLASSLPAGYQLTFEPGTQFAETMTIAPGGIPATNAGYGTATLTFTSNFQFTHQPNAVVCEPLPAGYSSPSTWDPNSLLGAGYGQFASAATSGTQQIQIGPWTDAAANLLTSDLNCGDLLQLGVGTANFEGYNLLHPDISTAGEGAIPLAAGASGAFRGMSSDLGTPVVTASGTAFQGSKVWQLPVAASVSTPSGLIYLLKLPCTPGLAFDASMYVRSVTTGANPQVHIYLDFLDGQDNGLGSVAGPTTTLTGSPTASWTRKSTAGTAPAGTVWAQVGLVLDVAPSSAWSLQADGLQYEQNNSARSYQTCPQIASVQATGVFGNGNATSPGGTFINLAQPLVNNHAVGEYVCDLLPPGATSPLSYPGTARLAY